MKAGSVLLLMGGAFAVYWLSQFGIATGTCRIIFSGVSIQSLDTLIIRLTVQNVSNVNINVNSMAGDVYMNHQGLGNISFFGGVTVPANGEITIPCKLSLSMFSLPANIAAFINSGGAAADWQVEGNVNVNGLVLPFELDMPLPL